MGWIVLIGVVVSLGLLLYRFLRRAMPGNPDPTCLRCGYCVRGIPTFTCPECGSDLREVGIRPPRAIRPPAKFHPFTAILLWMTLVVFPVAYTWNGFMTTYGPFHFTWREYPTVHSNSEFLPLNLFLALQGQSTEPRRLTDYRSSRMIIATTSTRSQAGALTVDASAGTYEYANSKTTRVVRSGPLTSAAIREWLASHNYAPSADPRCAAAIDELATILIALQTRDAAILSKYPRNVVHGPLFRGARPLPPASNFAVQTGGPAIIPKYTAKAYAMLITLPVLVLAVGTFLILRRAKAKDRPYPPRRDAHTIPRP